MTDYTYTEELYLIPGKTTVIVSEPWNTIEEAEVTLLEKILSAVRLSLDAVRIIHQPSFDLSALSPMPERLIYFGPEVTGLAQYEVIQTEQSSVVMAASLRDLRDDADAKKKLWVALKQLFFAG